MDVHIPRAITEGLRLRAINVLTAQEDEMAQADDPILLDRAGELDRLLVTQDTDFLVEADRRAREQGIQKHHLCSPNWRLVRKIHR
jgi:predicted nuclease of predicted toxin-antitoxin system